MIGCIIQARTGSHRFPRKIYEDINGQNTLQRTLSGTFDSKLPDKIILAMPERDEEEFLIRRANKEFDRCVDDRFGTFFGNEFDLMDRYYNAAVHHGIDTIVRICADSPLILGSLIDEMIEHYTSNGMTGFLGNLRICDVSYPAGLAIEMFPLKMLEDSMAMTNNSHDREHITPFMRKDETGFDVNRYENQEPHTVISTRFDDFSFDTAADLELIKSIVEHYDKHADLNKAILEA